MLLLRPGQPNKYMKSVIFLIGIFDIKLITFLKKICMEVLKILPQMHIYLLKIMAVFQIFNVLILSDLEGSMC